MDSQDPHLFLFKQDEQLRQQTTAPYPSKPHDNVPSNTTTHEEHRPVYLYEYALGLKNIKATHTTYAETEVFVSKPMNIKGNVMEVELEATEDHPFFDPLSGEAIDRQTSIEYYVAYKQKPTASDWVPLLPKDQKEIKGERLLFSGTKAALRFPAVLSTIRVYQNGLVMNRSDYLLVSDSMIDIPLRESGSIYTVTYTPNVYKHNPHVLELNDYKSHVERITETFTQGTDINKTIHLSYTPFIDMEQILSEEEYNPNTSKYKPIQVTFKNGSIQGKNRTNLQVVEPYREELKDSAFTYNKTLYLDKSWSDLKGYNLGESYYGGFDYYQWKNRLTFTEHFNVPRLPENARFTHGNADIEVSYDALVTDFRLKIILRRNTATSTTATPKVNNYTLRFKVSE